jgi:hypothetical protein
MLKKLIIGAAIATVMGSANAAIVIDNTVAGSVTNNFNALVSGNVAGLISQSGATYGERFSGQTLSTAGGFDALSGSPSGPLSLLSNAVLADNIGILAFGSQVIYGDLGGAIGEGALSILFGLTTSLLGFDIVGTDAGDFTVQFFGASGNLLGSITETSIGDGFFGFRATAGEQIAGVSITNTDPAGIGYDNVTFNQSAAVPEPGSLALLGLGLAGIVALRRRQRD